jgi:hypothetical protein
LYEQSNNNENSKLAATLDMIEKLAEEMKDRSTGDEHLLRLIRDTIDELKQINRPPESRSFSEADSQFIASVTGVQNLSRRWTNYVCDESVFPQPGFCDVYTI